MPKLERKLQDGEIRVDLGDFLPEGRRFWGSDEVDDIVKVLEREMQGLIIGISREVHYRSSVKYQVLHIKVEGKMPKEEMFRARVGRVLEPFRTPERNSHVAATA